MEPPAPEPISESIEAHSNGLAANIPMAEPSEPHLLLRKKAFGWPVVGVVAIFVLGIGVSFMTSNHAIFADLFFVAGTAILLAKFWSWEEAKHETTRKTAQLLAGVTLLAIFVLVSACGLNHYINRNTKSDSVGASSKRQPFAILASTPTPAPNVPIPDAKVDLSLKAAPPVPKKEKTIPSTPPKGINGSDNTQVGDTRPINGNGNTVVGATDAHGNTILNQGGTAIGKGAKADSTSVAIGSGAGAGNTVQSPMVNYAPGGFAISGGNVINPIVNNLKDPPPQIQGLSIRPLADIPPFEVIPNENEGHRIMRASEYNRSLGAERDYKQMTGAPGLSISFRMSSPFTDPRFNINCDKPCVVTGKSVTESDGQGSWSSKFGLPSVITTGMSVEIMVRSQDAANPVTSATIEPIYK